MTRIQADAWRATPRGKRPKAATITYTLTAPARVRFVVRGPAPSCRVVARFAVRGRAGTNRVRFTGRIGRRRLAPGTYQIVADPGKGRPSRPVTVVVGNGPVERTTCDRRESVAAAAVFGALTTAFGGPSTANEASSRGTSPSSERSGVLPAVRQRVQQLPAAVPETLREPPANRISDSAGLPTWLIALIPLAGFLGILLGASAVGYVRRRTAYY